MILRAALLLGLLLLLCGPIAAEAQVRDLYDDVILLVNERSWTSKEIGSYFASRRSIPEQHIYRFQADTSESMDSATFTAMRWQLEGWMRANNLVDSVNYIVTTKGCPLRVTTTLWDDLSSNPPHLGGQASFEDCLALINGLDSSFILRPRTNFYLSPFYNSTQRFRRSISVPIYLVTRLDAYEVEQVKNMILRAETPAVLGDGEWEIDFAPEKERTAHQDGNDWMRGANDILKAFGMNVFFDTTSTYLHGHQNVVAYYSWGSNDGNSGGGAAAKPENTWLNGSIAETIVSTGGRSFTPGTGYGQSLVADWLAEGANAVKGYTDEPYLTSIAHADILFDRYASGWNMAESFAAASVLIAWRQVTVGDPKMRLRLPLEALSGEVDFGEIERYAPVFDTVSLTAATNGVTVVSATLESTNGGDDHLSFTATPIGKSFPISLDSGQDVRFALSFVASDYHGFFAQLNIGYRRSGAGPATLIARVPVRGAGQLPELPLPDTLDFGAPSGNETVRLPLLLVNNSATDTLQLNSLTFGGTDRARFALDSGTRTSQQIAPGETATIGVLYRPSGVGNHTARLTVYATARSMPHTIQLVGTSNTSGVEELRAEEVLLWPQPVRDELNVRIPERSGTIERAALFGMTGERITMTVSDSRSGETQLNLSRVVPGRYLLRLYSSRGAVIEQSITVTGE